MNICIVYDSQFGNTERIAQAIASTLQGFGPVRIERVDPEHPLNCQDVDLLMLGSPTQGFRATSAIQSFIMHVPFALLQNLAVVTFDTRIRGPWGSAARNLARRLYSLGVEPLLPPMSFFVKGTPGPLVEGEEERAARWALDVCQQYESLHHHLVEKRS